MNDSMIGGSALDGLPVGGTPIVNLQTSNNNPQQQRGVPQVQQKQQQQQQQRIVSAATGYGQPLVNSNAGGARNQQERQQETNGSILNVMAQKINMTEHDMYLVLFVSSIFYIGHNKILTKSLIEKFGDSSQHVAMCIVAIVTFFANKYFLRS